MKIKKILAIIIFILSVCIFNTTSYAAEAVEVELEVDKKEVKAGEKISVTVSVKNNTYEESMYILAGGIEFDDKLLKPIAMENPELTAEQQAMITMLTESADLEFEILSVKDKWIIGIAESGELSGVKTIIIIYLDTTGSDAAVEVGETKEIGEIEFEALECEEAKSTVVKFYEMIVDEELEIGEASTQTIKVQPKESLLEEMDDDDNDNNRQQLGSNNNNNNNNKDNKNNKDKADKELAYTGVEDVIPYIMVLIIVAILSYIKCKKYKNI